MLCARPELGGQSPLGNKPETCKSRQQHDMKKARMVEIEAT